MFNLCLLYLYLFPLENNLLIPQQIIPGGDLIEVVQRKRKHSWFIKGKMEIGICFSIYLLLVHIC